MPTPDVSGEQIDCLRWRFHLAIACLVPDTPMHTKLFSSFFHWGIVTVCCDAATPLVGSAGYQLVCCALCWPAPPCATVPLLRPFARAAELHRAG